MATLEEQMALYGVPEFLDLPEEVTAKIETKVMQLERMFWLQAGDAIQPTSVTRTLLRRAVYAEVRVQETEHMLAEMALITEGAAETVKNLEAKVAELAEATS
jgi:hypothetical protein